MAEWKAIYQYVVDEVTLWQLQEIARITNTQNLSEATRNAFRLAMKVSDEVLEHPAIVEASGGRRRKQTKLGFLISDEMADDLVKLSGRFDGNRSMAIRYVIKKAYAAIATGQMKGS